MYTVDDALLAPVEVHCGYFVVFHGHVGDEEGGVVISVNAMVGGQAEVAIFYDAALASG